MAKKQSSIFLVLVFAFLFFVGITPLKAEYLIESGDKIQTTVFQWPEYSGISRVSPMGDITLPGIGRLPARGLSLGELEKMIEGEISNNSTRSKPKVVVEIIEFRPISILGDVQSPGQYSYDQNLTVLHAVAMAGGFRRLVSRSSNTFTPRLLHARTKEQIDILMTEKRLVLARRARLLTEQSGQSEVQFPVSVTKLRNIESLDVALKQEEIIFALQKKIVDEKIQLDPALVATLESEIKALKAHETAMRKSIGFMREELARKNALLARGLARSNDILRIEYQIVGQQSELRKTILDESIAQSRIIEVMHNSVYLRDKRQIEVAEELVKLNSEIAVIDKKLSTQSEILVLAGREVGLVSSTPEIPEDVFSFRIIRNKANDNKTLDVGEGFLMNPGDILRVIRK